MNARDLEKRVVKYYQDQGYKVERTHPGAKLVEGKYVSTNWDFFGCFDGISIREGEVILWQSCSGTTFAEHRRNIEKKFPLTMMPIQEIDYFYKDKGRWQFTRHRRTGLGWQI